MPYAWLVTYSFKLFGANAFAVRFPSAFMGVLCIMMTFWFARKMFGDITAVLSSLFIAISPFAIGWSRISRFYTLFQFLFLLGLYVFYLGYERGDKGIFAKWQDKLLHAVKLTGLSNLLRKWQINIFLIAIAGILFYISYLVHQLTALFAAGLFFYATIMFVIEWRNDGIGVAVRSKYLFTTVAIAVLGALAMLFAASFVEYAITYTPKWAEGTRFQDRKLYLDFLFDHYNFPMGALFFIGLYQIIARVQRRAVYAMSFFVANLALFVLVFTFRHFQYLYNVYPLFIMVSAFAVANVVGMEFESIKKRWFPKTKLKQGLLMGLVFCGFLAWLPLTPSVRLARRIPVSPDGSFNGAMYMEEWRGACKFVGERIKPDDLVISTDALGTLHYLGHVDYDLNFADLDLAHQHDLRFEDGRYFDLYSGKPFITEVEQIQHAMTENKTIWVLGQRYKLLEAPVFVPLAIRKMILANFERVHTTDNNTVVVFRFAPD